MTIMDSLPPISRQIWEAKYRFVAPEGSDLTSDLTIEDTWRRVAKALAAVEDDPKRRARKFYAAMDGFRFLPAGRIMAGAGTGRDVTMMNCYVMGTIPDSLDGIFTHLREAALTMQQGGGIGYDFSTLRPEGAPVKGVGSTSSGPLSFMDTWDTMCRTIMSAGARRGAMMATMRVDHPDVLKFIDAKRDPARLRNFNLSVLVTDAFMTAVETDGPHELHFNGVTYGVVRARDVWERMLRATYDVAEPGVVFIDRINRLNPLGYCEEIAATNPCGEQPLPPYNSCDLGSINLAAFVREPFTSGAALDIGAMTETVATAVRMLDNVIDVTRYPLEAQRLEALNKRRIGLGVTGLADALIMFGVRYGTVDAATIARDWMRTIEDAACAASVRLAWEKGAFPAWDRAAYLRGRNGHVIERLDHQHAGMYFGHGIRNGLLTSIAPAGTISLVARNVSSGGEPVFAGEYDRKVLQPDGSRVTERVTDFALARWRETMPDTPFPPAWVTAQDLMPEEHVRMQAALQAHVDSAVSKTVNVPVDISFDDFRMVYLMAWYQGCKGCTTYRPNDVTGSVLSIEPEANEAKGLTVEMTLDTTAARAEISGYVAEALRQTHEALRDRVDPVAAQSTPPPAEAPLLARPERLMGATHKLKWQDSEHALYVTINDTVDGGVRRPFEIFINSKNLEHHAWTVALTRMISAVWRRGGDVAFVAEELRQVFDPRGGAWSPPRAPGGKGRYVPSLVAAIGDVIDRHLREITAPSPAILTPSAETATLIDAWGRMPSTKVEVVGGTCPKCSQPSVFMSGGCRTCSACGWSKCE